VNIINVLLDSLKLLKRRPQLFVPKLTSALISSVWIIVLFEMLQARQLQQLITYYTATTPIIILLGVFVPLMTAEMIRSRDKGNLLRYSFVETLRNWREVLGVTFLMFIILLATSIPAILGLMGTTFTGTITIGFLGVAVSFLMILALSFLIYFLPISVLSENGLINGVQSSVNTSLGNSREVSILMLFSFTLFLIAFASQGATKDLGFAAFILGRLISATVTTYTFVISPNYYLKEKEAEESKKDSETGERKESVEESSEEKE
jgi:hypothetical protein